MRLWSLHPKYLDTKGLTACWREGLLARKVLLGETKGYRNHPQLNRFRSSSDPLAAIDVFLSAVLTEAQSRGYNYDGTKIRTDARSKPIPVTQGQLEYELKHLRKKLLQRSPAALRQLDSTLKIIPNPLFVVIEGEVESWEQVSL